MKKGISPLIAAVLLVVIVVAIAAVIMGWINTFISSAERSVTNRTDETFNCQGASIKVQRVFVSNATTESASDGTGTVVVQNDGLVDDLRIVSAVMFNGTGANFTASGLPVEKFDRGDITTLSFGNVSFPQCDDFNQVVVSTQCPGVGHEWKETPVC